MNTNPKTRGGSKPGTRVALRRTRTANPNSLILQVRQLKHWTQQQMADALGVSRKQVNVWEKTNCLPAEYEPRKKFENISKKVLTK